MAETGSTSIAASSTTGAICLYSGPYKSNRNAKVTVFISKGQRFPADTDGKATTWTMVK